MGELIFVVRTFVLAVVVLALMQFKVGGETLEAKGIRWIETSSIGMKLQDVADGAVKLGKATWAQGMEQLGLRAEKVQGFRDWKVEFNTKSEEKASKD